MISELLQCAQDRTPRARHGSLESVRFAPLCLALLVVSIGCKAGNPPRPAVPPALETPSHPVERQREQIRSSAVQIQAGLASLNLAKGAAVKLGREKAAPKELRDGMKEVADLLAGASQGLKGLDKEPPALDQFRKQTNRDKRIADAANAISDSLHDIREAQGILDSLADSTPGRFQNPLEGVDGYLDEAVDAVRGALETLGGKEADE